MMRAKSLAEFKEAIRSAHWCRRTTLTRTAREHLPVERLDTLLPRPWRRCRHADLAHRRRLDAVDSIRGSSAVAESRGGYIQNENDSPHFTNVRGRSTLSTNTRTSAACFACAASSRLTHRQHAEVQSRGRDPPQAQLPDAAGRSRERIIAAVRPRSPQDVAAAVVLLQKWNNTVAPDGAARRSSRRGSDGTQSKSGQELFSQPWTPTVPLKTPRGRPSIVAATAFAWAVEDTKKRYGRIDVTWGDVHRIRRGRSTSQLAAAGALGCFRVLGYARDPQDGKFVANLAMAGCWQLSSAHPCRAPIPCWRRRKPAAGIAWHDDQAAMFAQGRLKKVAFTSKTWMHKLVVRYRPGER